MDQNPPTAFNHLHNTLGSEDGSHSGCQDISQCHQQQFFSKLDFTGAITLDKLKIRLILKSAKDHLEILEGYQRFPKITRVILKIVEDYPKTSEDFHKLPKIAKDGLKTFKHY